MFFICERLFFTETFLIYWILILLMWYYWIPNTFSRDIKIMLGSGLNKPALYPTQAIPTQQQETIQKLSQVLISSPFMIYISFISITLMTQQFVLLIPFLAPSCVLTISVKHEFQIDFTHKSRGNVWTGLHFL